MNDSVTSPAMPGFKPDFKKIIDEVKTVATDPVGCWSTVRGTYGSIKEYYLNFLAPLAAIPVIMNFIKSSIIGFSVPMVIGDGASATMRTPFLFGIVIALVQFAFALGLLWVMSFVLGKIATKFGGTDDQLAALKLSGYSYAPANIAAILTIIPFLGPLLAALVGLYGIYIFYQGISPMLSVPAEKRLIFFGVSIAVFIVTTLIVTALVASVIAMSGAL